MRIAVIGANGQLGTDLCRTLTGAELFPFVLTEFDICEHEQAAEHLARVRPDVVINTAAYLHVDRCEVEVQRAFDVNAVAVHALARWCTGHGAVLVHFSTDYVFSGAAAVPYSEATPPEPINVYGASKLAGEWLLKQACPRHFLIRTSGLYGSAGSTGKGGLNFVERMLQLARERKPLRVVADQVLSPTYTVDLARAVAQLIRTERFGLFHITNRGACSWYDLAKTILTLEGIDAHVSPINSSDYAAPARRPAFSALEDTALAAAGLPDLPPWEDALARYLRARL